MQLRDASPDDYPCIDTNGYYLPTSGCTKLCCKVPAITPSDQDSPKWLASLARQQDEESEVSMPGPMPNDLLASPQANVNVEAPVDAPPSGAFGPSV